LLETEIREPQRRRREVEHALGTWQSPARHRPRHTQGPATVVFVYSTSACAGRVRE
jgi:hypothetical protein